MVRAKGTCRICGYQGMLDPHHIISQSRARRIGKPDLISNPGNVVHICRHCHQETTSYLVRKFLEVQDKKPTNKKSKKKPKPKKKAGMFDDLRKLYPPDHWLFDDESWDQDLSLDFEIAGGRWTKDGGAILPPKTKRGYRIVIPPPENWPEEW